MIIKTIALGARAEEEGWNMFSIFGWNWISIGVGADERSKL
jgi:hypothetical protein